MVSATTHYAVCVMNPDGDSGVKGIVKFTQVEGEAIKISAQVSGLTPGNHGFHIHQFGKFSRETVFYLRLTYVVLQEISLRDARLLGHTGTQEARPMEVQVKRRDMLEISVIS